MTDKMKMMDFISNLESLLIEEKDIDNIPLLAIRDMVIFPHNVAPIRVGREESVEAVEKSLKKNKLLFLTAQKDGDEEEVAEDNLYDIGTCAYIIQSVKMPDNTLKVLVDGLYRAKVHKFKKRKKYLAADIKPYGESINEHSDDPEIEAQLRILLDLFEEYVQNNKKIPFEMLNYIKSISSKKNQLFNVIASQMMIPIEDKQEILEIKKFSDQVTKLNEILVKENEIMKLERELEDKVKKSVMEHQKNFFLNEQMKAIKKELGYGESNPEVEKFVKEIESSPMPDFVKEKAKEELDRLKTMQSSSPEANVISTYLDWLIKVPWTSNEKADTVGIKAAKQILEDDHFGLNKAKERIIEHLAVLKHTKKSQGSILCFVGPPGVGKTSIGKSVARALNRNFVRVSLGGVRDEAEIRGHRRTYIGAMPGKIIQSMKKSGSNNPVFLLDEIDKMSSDFRGDPASAMLEVLDPEQNNAFNDHYLDVDYDLSNVFFITTANLQHNIPKPLLDRMEIIRFPGYVLYEKIEIAKNFIIPKLIDKLSLKERKIEFSDAAVEKIILNYTKEAGVRQLEKNTAKILRKIVSEIVEKNPRIDKKFKVNHKNLKDYLGVKKFEESLLKNKKPSVGVTTGLAWTSTGGEILRIETLIIKDGKGHLELTGNLGKVMQESAKAAISYAKANHKKYKIPKDFSSKYDIHVHVPEGAIPKDGPSAGITMAASIISALSNKKAKHDIAMTGELTIKGEVLPIGGLLEKSVAALQSGIKTVIIPQKNVKNIEEFPEIVKNNINFIPVEVIDEVLKEVLAND